MSLKLLTATDFRRIPWQNGGGTTLELVRHDDAAGELLWRLSVADVVEPGPFSPLPGIDRVITLIEGEGFDLDFGGVRPPASLRPFKPLSFSGDWSTAATTVRGPSRDFNVMTARGRIEAEVEVAEGSLASVDIAYVFAVRGGVTAMAKGRKICADAGELIECRQEDAIRIEADKPECTLAVRLKGIDVKSES